MIYSQAVILSGPAPPAHINFTFKWTFDLSNNAANGFRSFAEHITCRLLKLSLIVPAFLAMSLTIYS